MALGFDVRDNLVPLSRHECTLGAKVRGSEERTAVTAEEEESERRVNGKDSQDAAGRGLETRRCFARRKRNLGGNGERIFKQPFTVE